MAIIFKPPASTTQPQPTTAAPDPDPVPARKPDPPPSQRTPTPEPAPRPEPPPPIPGEGGSGAGVVITPDIGLQVRPGAVDRVADFRLREEAAYIPDESAVDRDVAHQRRLDEREADLDRQEAELLAAFRATPPRGSRHREAAQAYRDFLRERYGRPYKQTFVDAVYEASPDVPLFDVLGEFGAANVSPELAAYAMQEHGQTPYQAARGQDLPRVEAVEFVPVVGTTVYGLKASEDGFTRGELAMLAASGALDIVGFVPGGAVVKGPAVAARATAAGARQSTRLLIPDAGLADIAAMSANPGRYRNFAQVRADRPAGGSWAGQITAVPRQDIADAAGRSVESARAGIDWLKRDQELVRAWQRGEITTEEYKAGVPFRRADVTDDAAAPAASEYDRWQAWKRGELTARYDDVDWDSDVWGDADTLTAPRHNPDAAPSIYYDPSKPSSLDPLGRTPDRAGGGGGTATMERTRVAQVTDAVADTDLSPETLRELARLRRQYQRGDFDALGAPGTEWGYRPSGLVTPDAGIGPAGSPQIGPESTPGATERPSTDFQDISDYRGETGPEIEPGAMIQAETQATQETGPAADAETGAAVDPDAGTSNETGAESETAPAVDPELAGERGGGPPPERAPGEEGTGRRVRLHPDTNPYEIVPADVMPAGYPRIVRHRELVLVLTDLDTGRVEFQAVQPIDQVAIVARDSTPPTPSISGMAEFRARGRDLEYETLPQRVGRALKPGSPAANRAGVRGRGRKRGKGGLPIWGPIGPGRRR